MFTNPFQHLIDSLFDFDGDAFAQAMASIRPVGNVGPKHRSSGQRAHRNWKRTRAAGITKRTRR
jgi:hypothetical protein